MFVLHNTVISRKFLYSIVCFNLDSPGMLICDKQNGRVLCLRSRNQHYALICTTPLFCILAPTCFGSSLPSSGSVLGPSELLEIQIE
jgi:hypothetical protein